MFDSDRLKIAVYCLAIGILIGILIHYTFDGSQSEAVRSYSVAHDTAFVYKFTPIRIDSVRTKIRYCTRIIYVDSIQKYTDTIFQPYYDDSLLITKPFAASLDTIIGADTIKARFIYPQNLFSLSVGRHADTIRYTWRDSIHVIEQSRTFWDKLEDGALWFLGGVLVGGGAATILNNRR